MLDVLLGQAVNEGLIELVTKSFIEITFKGKTYALNHKIVQ